MDFIMLKLIRRLSTQKALFECFYCKSIYETLEEAIQARQEANVKYGFHSNHGK